jgi:predicted transcriptional regulator
MEEKFDKVLKEFKEVSSKNLELHKNQTKQVLENLEFEIKNIKDKLTK